MPEKPRRDAVLVDLRCSGGLRPHNVVFLFGYPHRLLWRESGSTWWAYRLKGMEWLVFAIAEQVSYWRASWHLWVPPWRRRRP